MVAHRSANDRLTFSKPSKVVEVAVQWAAEVTNYELQISRNAQDWTPVASGLSGLSGETVRTLLPQNAAATQWIRVAP